MDWHGVRKVRGFRTFLGHLYWTAHPIDSNNQPGHNKPPQAIRGKQMSSLYKCDMSNIMSSHHPKQCLNPLGTTFATKSNNVRPTFLSEECIFLSRYVSSHSFQIGNCQGKNSSTREQHRTYTQHCASCRSWGALSGCCVIWCVRIDDEDLTTKFLP